MAVKEANFIVGSIDCDWVTVGSFDQRNKRRWELTMKQEFPVAGYDRKMQMYTGTVFGGGFVGQAEQNGQVHTIARSTGGNAEKVIYKLIRNSAGIHRFTRIDIQLTVPLPDFHSARKLRDSLQWGERMVTSLVENTNGLDTVYVGSRQSARFWRIYVKEDDKGNRYLRFEIEVKPGKDELAHRLALHMSRNGKVAMVSFFFDSFDRIKNMPPAYISLLKPYRGVGTSPLPVEVRDTGGKTFKWLDTIVRKSILRYSAESHGRGEFMIHWLIDLIDDVSKSMEDD